MEFEATGGQPLRDRGLIGLGQFNRIANARTTWKVGFVPALPIVGNFT